MRLVSVFIFVPLFCNLYGYEIPMFFLFVDQVNSIGFICQQCLVWIKKRKKYGHGAICSIIHYRRYSSVERWLRLSHVWSLWIRWLKIIKIAKYMIERCSVEHRCFVFAVDKDCSNHGIIILAIKWTSTIIECSKSLLYVHRYESSGFSTIQPVIINNGTKTESRTLDSCSYSNRTGIIKRSWTNSS